MESEQQQRREFYRLRFPPAERPTLHAEQGNFVVLDVSEGGVRAERPRTSMIAAGEAITGSLEFAGGSQAPVSGEVLRVEEKELVIRLQVPFDMRLIVAEQRRLLQKYPGFFE